MSMTSAQIVVLRNPSLSGDSRLDDMISLAETKLSSSFYGDCYAEAVALLVLHWYAKESRGGAAGSVASETEGRLSRSFATDVGSSGGSDWSTTSWGQELETLTNSIGITVRNRMVP
jgi:hypothetical protein